MSDILRDMLKHKPKYLDGGDTGRGFQLECPAVQKFNAFAPFHDALKAQENALAVLDTGEVDFDRVALNGEVSDTGYRLSEAAFGDMCHFAKVPVSFIKQFARRDERLALDVIESCLRSTFVQGTRKNLVVDTRINRIEGIVSADGYSPLPNVKVVDMATSTIRKGFKFAHGWIDAPRMRTAIVDDLRPVEPRKGDIVKCGLALESAVNGDLSVRVNSYCERLVCTNGMTRQDKNYAHTVRHVGDVEMHVGRAVVQCAEAAYSFGPMMQQAVNTVLGPEETERVLHFISNPKNGGNETLKKRAIVLAQQEAGAEGRDPFSLTAWNWVNSITAYAHEAPSLKRRVEVETLGFRLLAALQPSDN